MSVIDNTTRVLDDSNIQGAEEDQGRIEFTNHATVFLGYVWSAVLYTLKANKLSRKIIYYNQLKTKWFLGNYK